MKPMVEKAMAPEHKIKTSLLEQDEVKNYYKDDNDKYKPIFINETIGNIKAKIKKQLNGVYVFKKYT